MTKRMKRTANAGKPNLAAHDVEITAGIPLAKLRALARAKQPVQLVLGKVPIQQLAELNAHWYESELIALSFYPKRQSIQIYVRAKEAEQLMYPQSGIKRNHRGKVNARVVTPDEFPVYYPLDLLRAESG